MDCADIQQFLHAYIDEELDERETMEFELHFEHCSSCRNEAGYYRSLQNTVRHQMERVRTPAHLRTSILQKLDEETQPTFGWFSLSMATAGALMCALGICMWTPTLQDNLPVAQRFSQPRISAPLASMESSPLAGGRYKGTNVDRVITPTQTVAYTANPTTKKRCLVRTNHPSRHTAGWLDPGPVSDSWKAQVDTPHALKKRRHHADTLCDPPRVHPFLIRTRFER